MRQPVKARAPSRLRTFVRRGLLAIAGLFAFYLVAMNVFLGTRLFRNLVAYDEDALKVEYTRAYSVVPWHVHAENLVVRGSDANVQWILRLDRCDFVLAPIDLFHRRFHVHRVHGDGLALRVRQRLEPKDATPDVVRRLPPVDGFSDPPLLLLGPPPAPLTDADYDLWSVLLEGVDADHVREVWIDEMRYAGDLRVVGRWFFRPLRVLDIGPANVEVRNLDVGLGADLLARNVTGALDLRLGPFDIRETEASATTKYLSVHGALRGTAPMADGMNVLLHDTGVHLSGIDATADAALDIVLGTAQPGTRARVDAPSTSLTVKGFAATASSRAELIVEPSPARPVARLSIAVPDARIDEKDARLHVTNATADFTSDKLALEAPFGDTTFRASVEELATETLGAWARRAAPGASVAVSADRAAVALRLAGTVDGPRAHGDASLAVKGLAIRAHDVAFDGDASADVAIAELSPAGISGSAAAIVRDLVVRPTAPRAGVALRATVVRLAATDAHVRAGSAGAGLALHLPTSEIPDAAAFASVLGLTGVDVGGRGQLAADVEASFPSGGGHGDIHLRGQRLVLHTGGKSLAGDVAVDVVGRRRGGAIDLAGTRASVTNVRAADDDGWWANLVLESATLDLAPALRFLGSARATARDAHPVVSAFLADAHLPGWAANVFRMANLRVQADVLAQPGSLTMRSVVAHAAGASIRAEYTAHAEDKQGAALVELGPLTMGIPIAQSPGGVVLIGAPSWFDARVDALRRAER